MDIAARTRSALRAVRTPSTVARATAAVVVVAVIALTGVVGHGNDPAGLLQSSGSAWLESPELGVVSLVDGASREVTATVAVATPRSRIAVSQRGSSAYVSDTETGSVSRVDGGSLDVARNYVFGEPGDELRVLHGGDAVFVVDAPGRVVTRIDPESLLVEAELPMPAVPQSSQAVVDDEGRLWVVDSLGRGLVSFDHEMHGPFDVVPADARLLVVRGEPVVVRLDVARASPVDPAGRLGASSCLNVRPDDSVQLLGSSTRDEIFATISTTGQLVVSDLSTHRCSRQVDDLALPGDPTDFGPMAQLDRFLFVPNLATGQTSVVDTNTDQVIARLPLTEVGNRIDLVAKDGIVFYNDLDGHRAGVIALDGGSWQNTPVDKFDPATKTPAVPVDEPDAIPASPEASAPRDDEPAPESSSAPTTKPAPGSSASPTTDPSPEPGDRRSDARLAPRAPGQGGSGGRQDPSPQPSSPTTDPRSPPTITRLTVDGQEEASSSGEVEVRATETITFVAETDRAVSTWDWTVTGPDGRELPSTDAAALQTMTFDDEGQHTVTVTVSDDVGTSDPVSLTVLVLPAPESAPEIVSLTYEGQPVAPTTDTPITFTAEVAGRVETWLWELFATGGQSPLETRSTAGTAVFPITTPGTFRVDLTVSGPGGTSPIATVPFQVVAAPPPLSELTVLMNGSGALTVHGQQGCGDAVCTYQLAAGTAVTVGVHPDIHFPAVFDGWGGPCSGTAPTCSFTMPVRAATVSATFHDEPATGVIRTGDDCDRITWTKRWRSSMAAGTVEVELITGSTVWRKGLSLPTPDGSDPARADLVTPDNSSRTLSNAASTFPQGTLRFWKAKALGNFVLLPYDGYSIGLLPSQVRITFVWEWDDCGDEPPP